jgi:tetratricopeptide (TPR) repeat protein
LWLVLLMVAGLRVGVLRAAPAEEPNGAASQALALEQQGKLAEAEAAWKSELKAHPEDAQGFAHLGLLQARQEHYAEAIASYRKAQTLARTQHKTIPQLNLNMGLALFKSGQFREAGKLFDAELKANPEAPGAQRLQILGAMSHYGAHEYAAAIPLLKEAAAADAKNLPLRLTLAHCYLWTKQFEAALDVYTEMLAIDPNSAEADMIAGEALDAKGDSAGAEKQFRAAAEANSKEPNVHFGLAYLLWEGKRYDEAVAEFKAELANDPRNAQAMIYLGDTYVQMSRFDEARPMLETAVASQGMAGEMGALAHLNLGIVRVEAGEKDAAVVEFRRAIVLDPENVTAHFRLGRLYQAMGKKDEAKAELEKASSLNKKNDDGLYKRIGGASGAPVGR